jgi:hypothetical protein
MSIDVLLAMEAVGMPETKLVAVKDLTLDLANFRTVRQSNETSALQAMISTSPDRFWALTESLIQDGYLPTESVIVLRTGPGRSMLIVKEGNRRVAALKLLLKQLSGDGVDIPESIASALKAVTSGWREENTEVPCTIFDATEAAKVDRIVRLAHGKGEKAGRDQWNAVARARHNREVNRASEPALDLLEKYLEHGKNVTDHQKSRWAATFPLTILAEAMKRLAPRLGLSSSPAIAQAYPSIKHRQPIESVIHAIGLERLGFDRIRDKDDDFAVEYGLPAVKKPKTKTAKKTATKPTSKATSAAKSKAVQRAVATGDPRAVKRLLIDFQPVGKKREKLVALLEEAIQLDFRRTPMAFCFVVRSMFEISAKAYCSDHSSTGGPSITKSSGQDRALVDLLRDITKHLTNNNADKEKVKLLHGAMTELGRSEGLLSVTSLNQLIHNPRFSVAPFDIAVLFGNVFPLLEAMSSN